ncbi:hypothetical protein U9M48_043289 [Paspalum notatum var. saurae]|uniref:Uncharacterized protein n=1 Tax=Paspalum notatum var. saurae TaxID=547442 RepID=A0AAQ3UWN6_PASNO
MDSSTASGSTDRNRKNNPSEDDSEPSAVVTSPASGVERGTPGRRGGLAGSVPGSDNSDR